MKKVSVNRGLAGYLQMGWAFRYGLRVDLHLGNGDWSELHNDEFHNSRPSDLIELLDEDRVRITEKG